MEGAHRHQLHSAVGEVEHLQRAGVFEQFLDLRHDRPFGVDEHVDGHVLAAEELEGRFVAVGPGGVLLGADAGDLARRPEERVADLAGHHVDFVAVGDGNQEVHVVGAGGEQGVRARGVAVDGLDVQPVLQRLQASPVVIHQRDVEVLAGEVFGQRPPGLAGAENQDLHGRYSMKDLRKTRFAGGTVALAPILTSIEARRLLYALRTGASSVSVSLDLGRSRTDLALHEDGVCIGDARVTAESLRQVADEDGKCFAIENGEAVPMIVFSEHTGWSRSLVPTTDAPTTMVAGFAMHRVVGTTPMADTRAKIRALGRPRGRALDTATGLGYTAIELARTCSEVVTVELDPGAIALARRNPWSVELFESPNIEVVVGDACEVVKSFAPGEFAVVLHDPPTLQLGGELYGGAFYAELHRVLRPGGRLLHYTGDPTSGAGARVVRGVTRRLAEAGFVDVRVDRRAFGVTARAGRSVRRRRRPPNSR